jgi:hypothetical protein
MKDKIIKSRNICRKKRKFDKLDWRGRNFANRVKYMERRCVDIGVDVTNRCVARKVLGKGHSNRG